MSIHHCRIILLTIRHLNLQFYLIRLHIISHFIMANGLLMSKPLADLHLNDSQWNSTMITWRCHGYHNVKYLDFRIFCSYYLLVAHSSTDWLFCSLPRIRDNFLSSITSSLVLSATAFLTWSFLTESRVLWSQCPEISYSWIFILRDNFHNISKSCRRAALFLLSHTGVHN